MADSTLDAQGLKCPVPIAKIAVEIKNLEVGQTLEVKANDRMFGKDVQAYCRVSRHTLESLEDTDGVFTAVIKKTA